MPVAVDLFAQIMSYNLDYQIFFSKTKNGNLYHYPKRIYKMFMFALQNGDDVLSTMIIKDARKKLKGAIQYTEGAIGGPRSYIPKYFYSYMSMGTIKFYTEASSGYEEDITSYIMSLLKPLVSVSRKGIEIAFQPPEQFVVSIQTTYEGKTHYEVQIQNEFDEFGLTFLSDWLFHFFVEGKEYTYKTISASSESIRKLRYGDTNNSTRIDARNKRKKIKKMLQSWKEKHQTLLGRMDINLLLQKIFYHSKISLNIIIYSL